MPHRHRTSSVPTTRPRSARPPAPRTLAPLVVLVLLGCSEAGTSGEVDADALRRLPATEIQRIGRPADTTAGVVELPRGLRPMWAGGGELLAVETDELGVPWLVRYRIGEA